MNPMRMKPFRFHMESTPRTLLFYFAVLTLLIATALSGAGFTLTSSPLLLAGCAVWLVWLCIIFCILLPKTDIVLSKRTKQLKRGALIIFILLIFTGLTEPVLAFILFPRLIQNQNIPSDANLLMRGLTESYQYNDGTALSHQAVTNLLNGKNPYAHGNIIQALLEYNCSYDRVTPLRVGTLSDTFPYPLKEQLKAIWDEAIKNPSQVPPELETKFGYPAGSFLLPAPFFFLGIKDIRIVYAIFVLAGLAYAVRVIPKRKRFLFIGVLLISLELWNSITGGETGSLVFSLLLIAWLSLNRNLWLSAIFMGLAVTTKQIAWFFIPFYLILLLRTQGIKKLLAVSSIIGGIFLITNLPFIIIDPELWLTSIMSPMTDPMFPLGIGLNTLVTTGILQIQSPLLFTILEGIAFIVCILWYFRHCNRYPQLGPILAIVPFFFAWRSLWTYFFYVGIISLAYIMANDNTTQKIIPSDMNQFDNKPIIPSQVPK